MSQMDKRNMWLRITAHKFYTFPAGSDDFEWVNAGLSV